MGFMDSLRKQFQQENADEYEAAHVILNEGIKQGIIKRRS